MGVVNALLCITFVCVLSCYGVNGLTGCWSHKTVTRYRLVNVIECCHGWRASAGSCSVAICTTSCKNGGSCVAPNTCRCPRGYTGKYCTTPTCSPSCKFGGTCYAPDKCKCVLGYTGVDCSEPICTPPCENNGTCVSPDKCHCAAGYNGTLCVEPICLTACFNMGKCVAPEKCKCGKHWTEDHCTRPVCNPPCSTDGICINPNECRYPTNLENKACHNKKLDVSFVVDTSSSIGRENFQRMKQFIKSVIVDMEISEALTHVSMIEFGLTPNVQFHLTDYLNKTALHQAIDNATYTGGATSTSDAIEMMRKEGFKGERPEAPDVGIVITDGLSKFPHLTRTQADLAKQEGVTMIAVGVGNDASHAELFGIASGLSRVFEVGDFKTLLAINEDVARTICEVELPKDYTPRTTTIPPTAPDGCIDTGNCTDYARDMCFDYEDWAKVHCARTCGFCGQGTGETSLDVECNNTIDDCDQYDRSMCLDPNYFDWVQSNCAEYCGFCGNKTDGTTVDNVEVLTTTAQAPHVCKDAIRNCRDYGGTSVCTDQTFTGWTMDNCPKYCGKCYNLQHYDARNMGPLSCPSWDLPEECSLVYKTGSCCPLPDCPPDLRLTVKRQ